MELSGKKILFLGDSITYGHGVADPDNVFSVRIARETGAVTRNFGISGTRIAHQTKATNEQWDQNFCDRVLKMDTDADIVVVFGGTNDYGHGDAPFGTDLCRTPDTFYGALHTLYTSLIEKYPTAVIAVLTPLHRLNETGRVVNEIGTPNGHPLSDYVAAIRQVAEEYSLPVLDLYAGGGIQPSVEAQRQALCPDGLHPNDAGHALLARRIIAFLKAL